MFKWILERAALTEPEPEELKIAPILLAADKCCSPAAADKILAFSALRSAKAEERMRFLWPCGAEVTTLEVPIARVVELVAEGREEPDTPEAELTITGEEEEEDGLRVTIVGRLEVEVDVPI